MDTKHKLENIQIIFLEAINIPTKDRAVFVEKRSNNNQEITREVLELLSYHQEKESLLDKPIFEQAVNLLQPEFSSKIEYISFYKIVKEIGRGGMATVYLAERNDEQYKQKIAIKLIQPALVTETLTKMFVSERQIMANLNHNNIAKLLDGGMTDYGSPYLVMEYIDGLPIDQFCSSLKMSVIERIKLFSKVCSAVQFAHQNLVVHRDIKPNNILVTSDGIPKLLDFGVAKLINHTNFLSTYTQPQNRFLTPIYASPEQISGQPITTTTDVYSLGVLLYELITGHLPYKFSQASPDDIKKVICEVEPIKPSQIVLSTQEHFFLNSTLETPKKLSKIIKGDLETIILKALSKEPGRRYSSVESLVEDLHFYLTGLPIKARKESLTYSLSKFVKRNKLQVVAASLLFLTLLGGIVATSWQAHRANLAQTRAEKRFNDVRKLANSFLFEFNDKITPLPGSTSARQLIVEKASVYLNSLAEETMDDKDLQIELITAYQKLGDIQGNLYFDNVGDSTKSLSSYYKALELSESLVKKYPTDEQLIKTLSSSNCKLGEVLMFRGNLVAAKDYYKKGLDTLVKIAATSLNSEIKYELPMSYLKMGDIYSINGNNYLALENYQQAVISAKKLFANEPNKANIRIKLVVCYNRFAGQTAAIGDPLQALQVFDKSAKICQQWLAMEPTNKQAYQILLSVYKNTSPILVRLGDTKQAIEYSQQVLKEAAEREQQDFNNVSLRRNLMAFYADLAFAQSAAGKVEDAIKNYRIALSMQEELLAKDPQNSRFLRDFGYIHSCLSELFIEDNPKEALQGYIKAKNSFEGLLNKEANNTQVQADLAHVLLMIAKLRINNGNIVEMINLTTRALEIQKSLADNPQALTYEINDYAKSLITCEPKELRDSVTAIVYCEKAAQMSQKKDPSVLQTLAYNYFLLDKYDQALQTAQEALSLIPDNGASSLRQHLQSDIKKYKTKL